jgi:hypothetical protein
MNRALLFALAVLATSAAAQEPGAGEVKIVRPTGSHPGGADVQAAAPSPPAPDLGPHQVSVVGSGTSRDRDSAGTTVFKVIQARQIKSGSARLSWANAERTVRPGDAIEGAVVKSIEPGRIVLSRSTRGEQDDLVVLSFDSAGRARVRVYEAADPGVAPAPAVR